MAPIRVAIVGGGCAGIATAFELTRPEHQGRYRVTLYQAGWRLGGKGASGRGPAGRIEEHGLHVWMGWYENAFRLLRECYREIDREWLDAFVPAPFVGVTDRGAAGQWEIWARSFPSMEGLPGDPGGVERPSVRDYALRIVGLLRTLVEGLRFREGGDVGGAVPPTSPAAAVEALVALVRYGEIATLTGMLQGISLLEIALASVPDLTDAALPFLDAFARNVRELLAARLDRDGELRRVWQVVDLALATLRGQIRFGLLTDPRGFDAVDDYDCREWLLVNGASKAAVDSGYMRGFYGLGFAYEGGDFSRPRVSAAIALRGFLRAFFTYRGALFWKMRGGMGDVVFAPFYAALKRRGVRFEFFHRLHNVRMAVPGRPPHVIGLDFDVQAETRDGGEYDPLIDVHGMPCWPSQPLFPQLADGDRARHEAWDFESHWDRRRVATRSLAVGKDFDLVVLAVGLGAIPHVCREIVARDPRWREMVEHVQTVATQAFQIWLTPEVGDLGWSLPPVTLSGFVEPFDSYADMRHLLTYECHARRPGGLAYFCGVLADGDEAGGGHEYALRQRARVRRNAIDFLNQHGRHLWPGAVSADGRFRWDLLAVPDDWEGSRTGDEARFDAQFWTANVNPSDRYTLALPGSSRYRISPLDGTYDNLTVAGDWTSCGVNTGCVEAAVMSGRLAAHAIARLPRLDDIPGFDHP